MVCEVIGDGMMLEAVKKFFYAHSPAVNRAVLIDLIEQHVRPHIRDDMLTIQKFHQYELACSKVWQMDLGDSFKSNEEVYDILQGFLAAKLDEFGLNGEF